MITVGILLALAARSWYDAGVQRTEERAALEELRTALVADHAALSTQLAAFRSSARKLELLGEHLAQQGAYSDTLDSYFGAMYGLSIVPLNASPYESLRSRGLGLVKDANLRTEITRLYDLRIESLDELHKTQRSVVLDALRPYFLRNFRDLLFHQNATPLDYNQVASDPEFRNLLDYRLQVMRAGEIPFYVETVGMVSDLIARLDAELNR